MPLENAPKEYRSAVILSLNIYNGYNIDFQTATILLHYLYRDSKRNFITYWRNWDC